MNDNIPTTMLDDLLATDNNSDGQVYTKGIIPNELNTVATQIPVGEDGLPSNDDFTPLDLRHLSHTDFSVVVAGVMKRLGTSDMTFTQEELSGLDAPEGQVSVLACTYSSSTGAVRFRILTGPKSEFRT